MPWTPTNLVCDGWSRFVLEVSHSINLFALHCNNICPRGLINLDLHPSISLTSKPSICVHPVRLCLSFQTKRKRRWHSQAEPFALWDTYCWWKKSHTTWDVWNLGYTGLPINCCRISSINSTTWDHWGLLHVWIDAISCWTWQSLSWLWFRLWQGGWIAVGGTVVV